MRYYQSIEELAIPQKYIKIKIANMYKQGIVEQAKFLYSGCRQRFEIIQKKINAKMRNPTYKFIRITTELINSFLVFTLGELNFVKPKYNRYYYTSFKKKDDRDFIMYYLTYNRTIQTKYVTKHLINHAMIDKQTKYSEKSKQFLKYMHMSKDLFNWMAPQLLPKQYKRVYFMIQGYESKNQNQIGELTKEKERQMDQIQFTNQKGRSYTTLIIQLKQTKEQSILCLVDSQDQYNQLNLNEFFQQDFQLDTNKPLHKEQQSNKYQIKEDETSLNKQNSDDQILISPKKLIFNSYKKQNFRTTQIKSSLKSTQNQQKQKMRIQQNKLSNLQLTSEQKIEQNNKLKKQTKQQQDEIKTLQKSKEQKKQLKQTIKNQSKNESNIEIYQLSKRQEQKKLQNVYKDLQQIRTKQQKILNDRKRLELQKNQEQEILRVWTQEKEQRKDLIAQLSQQRDQQVEHIRMLKLQQQVRRKQIAQLKSQKNSQLKDLQELTKTFEQNSKQKGRISAKNNLILCQTQKLKSNQNIKRCGNLIIWLCLIVFGIFSISHLHETSYFTSKHDFQIDKNVINQMQDNSIDPITKKQLLNIYKSCFSTESQIYCQQIIQELLSEFDQNVINLQISTPASSTKHSASPKKDMNSKIGEFINKNQGKTHNIKKEASRQSSQNYKQTSHVKLKTDRF